MRPFFPLLLTLFILSANAQERITLLFVGDLMQHQAQIKAAKNGDTYDYSACFRHVKDEISRADLAIGNLEVTLGGRPYTGYPAFSAPDEYLYAIRDAGFDVLLTANNHCLDRRRKGLERTIHLLDSLGIPRAGTYINKVEREQRYPLIVEKKGFRIALLNYTYGTNGIPVTEPNIVNFIDREQMKADILAARRERPDVIIACMHWGVEYRLLPERQELELADWLIAQGVDHVIGSHPHVVQPIEVHEDTHTPDRHVVAYSLGNFISNMSAVNTDGGVMVRLELQRAWGITQLKECSYSLVWTSRPTLNRRGTFELYPASFEQQPIRAEELTFMKRFLRNARALFEKHNKGIKEYFFE